MTLFVRVSLAEAVDAVAGDDADGSARVAVLAAEGGPPRNGLVRRTLNSSRVAVPPVVKTC